MKTKIRMLAITVALLMLIGLLPLSAFASESRITYVKSDGASDWVASELCTSVGSSDKEWNGTWYVVDSDVTLDKCVKVKGDVRLVLSDGKTLTASKGINVEGKNTLTIYAQSTGNDAGKLVSTAEDHQAGIGGGDREYGADHCGTIIINGGYITVTGGKNGAGIGGGWDGDGGKITINGGTVRAQGGLFAAGIGGGKYGDGGKITINGGNIVYARGGGENSDQSGGGAGIGGGRGESIPGTPFQKYGGGNGGEITITGGTINEAKGGPCGAGIGGGFYGNGGVITISGGTVKKAWGGEDEDLDSLEGGAGIGGGGYGSGGKITINGDAVIEDARGHHGGAGIGSGSYGSFGVSSGSLNEILIEGNVNITALGANGAGVGGGNADDGGKITIKGGTVYARGGHAAGIGGGSKGGDGGKITITGGKITAEGDWGGAGIGGGPDFSPGKSVSTGGNGGEITISGDSTEIRATGTDFSSYTGAGIGGATYAEGGKITINGGKITAIGGWGSAGIGGGSDPLDNRGKSGGDITINGGQISATGLGGAGIGGSEFGNGGNITINGGDIRAIGNAGAAGIGGGAGEEDKSGSGGKSGTIKITEGDVYAVSLWGGAGVGSGSYAPNGGSITISRGYVDAIGVGSEGGAGIGGGYKAKAPEITISGGRINAVTMAGSQGKNPSAGIGGGAGASGGTITISGGRISAGVSDYYSYSGSGIGIGSGEGGGESTLNLTHESGNSITSVLALNYNNCKVKIAEGKIFTDGQGRFYTGSLNAPIIAEIAGTRIYLTNYTSSGETVNKTEYLNPDGSKAAEMCLKVADNAELLNGQSTTNGWYVLDGKISLGDIIVKGDVNLILSDGAELDMASGTVSILADGSLTVWAQSPGDSAGEMTVKNVSGEGGVLTVNGGRISIEGKNPIDAGSVTVNGGSVYVNGTNSGISAGSLALNGGEVKVTVSESSGTGAVVLKAADGTAPAGIDDLASTPRNQVLYTDVLGSGLSEGGMTANGSMTVGGGSISVKGAGKGICAADLTVSGGKIEAEGAETGVELSGPLHVNGGEVVSTGETGISAASLTVGGGEVKANAASVGIGLFGDMDVTGGKVFSKAAVGIRAESLLVSGGECFAYGTGEGKSAIELERSYNNVWRLILRVNAGKLYAAGDGYGISVSGAPQNASYGPAAFYGGTSEFYGKSAAMRLSLSYQTQNPISFGAADSQMSVYGSDSGAAEAKPAMLGDRVKTLTEAKYAKVTGCLQHGLEYTDNGDGTHLAGGCLYCGFQDGETYGKTSAHTYTNHFCVCGAEQPSHTVTFHANNGGGDSTTQKIYVGEKTPLKQNEFSGEYNYYTFNGWNTVQNPTDSNPGTVYEDCAEVELDDGLVLYAQWYIPGIATPVFTSQPGNVSLVYGYTSGGTISVAAAPGDASSRLVYQWYRYTNADKSDLTAIPNAAQDTYSIPTGMSAGKYYYYCAVKAVRSDGAQSVLAASGVAEVEIRRSDALTVTPNGYEDVYDGKVHSGGASVNVTEGTVIEYSADGKTWSGNAPSVKDVGKFIFNVRATNPNYNDAFCKLILKVNAKKVTVTANDASKTFGEADPEFAVTVEGLVGNDKVNYTVGRDPGNNAGSYKIIPSGEAAQGNYAVSFAAGTFTINKAQLTLGVSIEGWTAGETAKTPVLNGNAGNGAVTYEYKLKTAPEAAYGGTVPTAAGDYTIRATVAETVNYLSGETTAEFTVSPAPSAPTYRSTEQALTWQKGSRETLDLTVHRSEDDHLTFGLFASLEIGGKTVGSENYTVSEGSLKLSVKPEYLETLSDGDHDVKVNFADGSVSVKLTVTAAASNPDVNPGTADNSRLELLSVLMIVCTVGAALLIIGGRKKFFGK